MFLALPAACAAAGVSRASAADPIRVGISASEESSLLFMAAERGFFKDLVPGAEMNFLPTDPF
jgi:ABC-type nitrate/sulfonate/bicarbonate transport system substrate-binding protein